MKDEMSALSPQSSARCPMSRAFCKKWDSSRGRNGIRAKDGGSGRILLHTHRPSCELEAPVSSTGEELLRPDGLFGCLKLHVFVDRKLRGRARGVVTGTGSDYTKATGTDLDLVGIRGPLPGNIRVVRRDQIVEGDILALAGEVPALGRGDTNQIAPYAGDVDGGLRVVRSGGSRRALRLLGINVHPNGQYNDDAEKSEQAAHVYPRGNCTAKRDG